MMVQGIVILHMLHTRRHSEVGQGSALSPVLLVSWKIKFLSPSSWAASPADGPYVLMQAQVLLLRHDPCWLQGALRLGLSPVS